MALMIYQTIPSFNDFAELSNDRHYTRLPQDWSVFVADIVGSTKAIEAGRYRDVNTVGSACVAVVKNALKGVDFPFVFGGDGASIVLPPESYEGALHALLALRRLVELRFGMELRVGAVTIREIEAAGAYVEVSRYEICEGMCIALFRGGGLTTADAKVKQAGSFEYTDSCLKMGCSLNGLSCRWHRIPSKRGCVLSLLVFENGNATERIIYDEVLSELDRIGHCNPVHVELATYKSLLEMMLDECRFHRVFWSTAFFARFFEMCLCVLFFRLKIFRKIMFDSENYAQSMRSHTDYRKFDDMLRMVIDCTDEQADFIESMLEERKSGGQLFYGIHRSQFTLMTCLVGDVAFGKHIHFVDGDDGGYAMAAKSLKKQLQVEDDREKAKESLWELEPTSAKLTQRAARGAVPSEYPTTEGEATLEVSRFEIQKNPALLRLEHSPWLELGHDIEHGHAIIGKLTAETKIVPSAA